MNEDKLKEIKEIIKETIRVNYVSCGLGDNTGSKIFQEWRITVDILKVLYCDLEMNLPSDYWTIHQYNNCLYVLFKIINVSSRVREEALRQYYHTSDSAISSHLQHVFEKQYASLLRDYLDYLLEHPPKGS